MTVKELIEKLKAFNGNKIVVINSTDNANNDKIANNVTVYEKDVVIE